jgi:hypothetical protein
MKRFALSFAVLLLVTDCYGKITAEEPYRSPTVLVATYFSDVLSMVDLAAEGCNAVSLPLSPSRPLSLVRQGELNFNDASACFQGWQAAVAVILPTPE